MKRFTPMHATDQAASGTGGERRPGAAAACHCRGRADEARPFAQPVPSRRSRRRSARALQTQARLPLHDWHEPPERPSCRRLWLRPLVYSRQQGGKRAERSRTVRRSVASPTYRRSARSTYRTDAARSSTSSTRTRFPRSRSVAPATASCCARRMLLDDGTTRGSLPSTSRHNHDVNAAVVLEHMEFHLQACARAGCAPDDVGDQWRSSRSRGRARVRSWPVVAGVDLSNDAFPFMGERCHHRRRCGRCSASRSRRAGLRTGRTGQSPLKHVSVLEAGNLPYSAYGLEALNTCASRRSRDGAELNVHQRR